MVKFNVNLREKAYPIYITTSYEDFEKILRFHRLEGKKVIIADTNTAKTQMDSVMSQWPMYAIEAGEKSKSIDTVKDIYEFCLKNKLDRNSTIIALGGGVVGDIAGFAAATYLRGINYVQVPTTMLAQADSSIGGKTGIDFMGAKNMVGAFYQPKFVYANISALKTLPERQLKAGLAEVIKHGMIKDEGFLEYIEYNMKKIMTIDEDVMKYIVKENCNIKAGIVEQDEKETEGIRAFLNFGHTVGHAVESLSGFKLYHGECVAIGMVAACKISNKMELLDETVTEKVIGILEKTGLPVDMKGMDPYRIYDFMMEHDKKREDGKLNFVLLKAIGEPVLVNDVPEWMVGEVLREMTE